MFLALISLLLTISTMVKSQGPPYSQCGGIGWSGATTCVAAYSCVVLNNYFWQCLPDGSAPSPTTTITNGPPTTTITGPAPTGSQIRTDQDPVYHLYLQNIAGKPVLGPESSSGYFTIGSTIKLNSNGTSLYLNIDTSATTSYKPLTLDATAKTSTWGLSGDTIIYGNLQNFIVCPISGSTNYNLYLSTSNDMPSGCTNYITIHLPCLC